MSGWGTIYKSTRSMLRDHAEQLAQLQATASSGARLRQASDSPADAYRLLGLRAESHATETYRDNLSRVSGSLNVASGMIQAAVTAVSQVKQLVTQGASGTYSAGNRAGVAMEINSLLEQVLSLANTKHGGRYLFGGNPADSAPYVAEYEDGRIARVTYQGSSQAMRVPVAPGVDYPSVLVGDEIFRSDQRQATQFHGTTGAAPGAGTSSVRGDVWLTVSNDSTTYLGASGIAPGDSAAVGDTVLGNGHTLTIDAPNRILRLNDGPTVTYNPGDTDVMLESAAGRAYVSTAALGGAFVGAVTIQTTGSLSVDDGASQTAIDFADANLGVTDSRTDRVLYVDCTGIEQAGLEAVRVPGTYDVFGTLIEVRDLLLNERDLSDDQQIDLLDGMAGAVSEVLQGLTAASVSVGSGIGVLDTLDGSLEDLQAYTNDQTTLLEDADIVQVAIDLARQQALYEMTLASASRLLGLSLFDYI